MNDPDKTPLEKPAIPETLKTSWQWIVDLMVKVFRVPAGLIVKAGAPELEVFVVGSTKKNPFQMVARFPPDSSLYCNEVIKNRIPVLIPDVLKDPKRARDPGGERGGISYYLGYPIAWPDGEIFGTICIVDTKTNTHATQFQELLSKLGTLIEKDLHILIESKAREDLLAELQRHRTRLQEMVNERTGELEESKRKLERRERDLTQAQRIACLGSFEWDIHRGTHHWSDEFYRILGLPPQKSEATYKSFLAAVHPDDRRAVDQANIDAISDPSKPYTLEYRIIRPDGVVRNVYARGEILPDDDGKSVRMIGTLHDISETERTREKLRKAFEEIKRLKEKTEFENVYLQEEMKSTTGFTGIIGISSPIQYVKYRIQQVARMKTTVLLTGETGSGKGLFARALHEASDRKDKLLVTVNCAGLPPTLIESELFGRERGAFTGSSERQIGRFELAHGGTLFLDEIGELPLDLQAKLLRAIEDGEFERVGSPHPVKVDVRIIASTNRYLEEEIKKGQFRKDLFYRLHIFPITIPPLRQRKEDIPLLAEFFADRFARNHSKSIRSISPIAMKALENYDWPGNVRELMNVIERSVIVSDEPVLQLAESIDVLQASPAADTGVAHIDSLKIKSLIEIERDYILHALRETGWRIEGEAGAARLLAMNPSTIRARMKKHGIRRPGSAPEDLRS